MSRKSSSRAGPRKPLLNRSRIVLLVLFAVVSVVAGAPYFIAADDARRPPADEHQTRLALPAGVSIADLQKVHISEVLDGDTIDVTLDGVLTRVRYYGVDTPERGDRCFREATDRNISLVGKDVLLLKDDRNTDDFGRLLRYIFLEDGTSVDATLVAEGYGKAWRSDGRYKQQIIDLEEDAEAAGRGCIW